MLHLKAHVLPDASLYLETRALPDACVNLIVNYPARFASPPTKMRTADDATRGEGWTTTTSNESGRWKSQGNDNGSNDGGGDVVALAVTRAGIGQRNETGRGEEEDAVMLADWYRQQSTKTSDGNGGWVGNSNADGNSNRDGNGNGNGAMATATTINNEQQQKKWRRLLWQRRWRWKQRQQQWKLWWQWRQLLLAPVKGRGNCCSDHRCHVSTTATTIPTFSAWTTWFTVRRLEGLF
jgi:hypothetical protein